MTSLRQITANRRNSEKSTGPKTEDGKRQSRRNALRHGLCAETVIEILEDIDDYKAFELSITSDYDAQTAVERELVLRLASLLWRIRRATSIETDLIRIQAEILRDRRTTTELLGQSEQQPQTLFYRVAKTAPAARPHPDSDHDWNPIDDLIRANGDSDAPTTSPTLHVRALAHCFQRLANLDNGVFERLGRYEASLWRQFVQTLFALQSARRRFSPNLRNTWGDNK
jgi:hypothetical protein